MLTKNDFCDYETCVALKELGYKVPTSAYYMPNNNQLIFVVNQFRGGSAMDCFYSNNSLPKECMASDFIDAPTMWEAQKWLREEKGLFVEVVMSYGKYDFDICSTKLEQDKTHKILCEICGYETYEEALSEGIKETIKILKDGNNN